MPKFLKLSSTSLSGVPVYMNSEKITAIFSVDGLTQIDTDDNGRHEVKETPEEILKMLEETNA